MLQGGTIHIGHWRSSRHSHFSGQSGGDNRNKQTLHAAAMPDVAPRQGGRRRMRQRSVLYQPLFPSLQPFFLLNLGKTSVSEQAGKKLHLLTRPECNFHRLKSHICQNTSKCNFQPSAACMTISSKLGTYGTQNMDGNALKFQFQTRSDVDYLLQLKKGNSVSIFTSFF